MTFEVDCSYCGTPYDSASRHTEHICPECREAMLDKSIDADRKHAVHGE